MRGVLRKLIALLPGGATGAVVHELRGSTMGTTWSVKLVAAVAADMATLRQGVQQELDLVVTQMSTWDPNSDLSRYNRAGAGSWQVLPQPLFDVLNYSLQLAQDTNGAYDPTAGALVNLWGFGPEGRRSDAPNANEIARASARGGWLRLKLDRDGLRALQPGGVYVDLSSVAKGYAVDRAACYLDAAGISAYLIEVGGELRARDHKPDRSAWRVAVERPASNDVPGDMNAPTQIELAIALNDRAMATSGEYRQGFNADGRNYSHTLDPRSGYPIAHALASVTVVHAHCMQADALATVLNVLGPEDGLSYAQRHDLAALFLIHAPTGFERKTTSAFDALLR